MNEQQPYEKHFTEKMRQLPLPDPDRSWQQMHALLDKEMPPGSTGSHGGIGGSGTRWWMISIGAGIIFAGTWFSGRQFMTKNRPNNTVVLMKTDSAATPASPVMPPSSVNGTDSVVNLNSHQTTINDDKSTLTIKQFPATLPAGNTAREDKVQQPSSHDLAGMPGSFDSNSSTDRNNNLPSDPGSKKDGSKDSHPERRRAHRSGRDAMNNGTNERPSNTLTGNHRRSGRTVRNDRGDGVNDHANQKSPRQQAIANNQRPITNSSTRHPRGRLSGGGDKENSVGDRAADNSRLSRSVGVTDKINDAGNKTEQKNKGQQQIAADRVDNKKNIVDQPDNQVNTVYQAPDSKPDEEVVKPSLVKVSTAYPDLNAAPPFVVFDEVMPDDYAVALLPLRTERITSSPHRSRTRSAIRGDEKVFTAGLSFPLSFPIGQQKPLSYNINATPNIISDYLPVPHFQFHFNQKLYAQAEVQMISPQYTPDVCIGQYLVLGGREPAFISYTARKLYYFSLPVSLHYSPFRNLYVGTGLQYSRFMSGVASMRKTLYSPPGGYYNIHEYVKFPDFYPSSPIKTNEWRVLLDISYNWNRLTAGLRYNQALGNYVTVHIPNTEDHTQDKNKSLQFYFRYNLFETFRRPKQLAGAGSLLTLK